MRLCVWRLRLSEVSVEANLPCPLLTGIVCARTCLLAWVRALEENWDASGGDAIKMPIDTSRCTYVFAF